MKFHVFTDTEALCIEADGYRSNGSYTLFYQITGTGTETTFPDWWQRLLGQRKERRRVEVTEPVEAILTSTIRRVRWFPASGIEAASAGETAKQGSTGTAKARPAKRGTPND